MNLSEDNLQETLRVEEAFQKLDALLARLRSEEIPLEDSFSLYQEGLKLIDYLNSRIDGYEKQLEIWDSAAADQ